MPFSFFHFSLFGFIHKFLLNPLCWNSTLSPIVPFQCSSGWWSPSFRCPLSSVRSPMWLKDEANWAQSFWAPHFVHNCVFMFPTVTWFPQSPPPRQGLNSASGKGLLRSYGHMSWLIHSFPFIHPSSPIQNGMSLFFLCNCKVLGAKFSASVI